MALNPWQQAISDLARSMGLQGQQEQNVYQTPQFQNLINQFFGNIPLPAGIDESMVVSRSPNLVEYKDPQGFIHRLERDINGLSPRLGEVKEVSTNRPSVLPLSQDNNPAVPGAKAQSDLTTQLTQTFQTPPTIPTFNTPDSQGNTNPAFADLANYLKTISASENALQEDAFKKAQGTAVAQLVGRGVGSSSIAGTIMDQLLQGQGLVRGQTQANQASRELDVGKFLAGLQQTQDQSLQQFITQLLGLGTERDIAGANIDTQRTQIGNQNEQFYANLQQQILQFQEQMRQQERQNLLNNIFRGVSAATGIASGIGGLFGGGALPSGGGAIAPPAFPIPTPQRNTSVFGGI